MRSTDFSQESSSSTSPSSRRFSILSRRRDQVYSMDAAGPELEAFQRQVGERFQELSAVDAGELLSISWIRKLLDVFLSCQDQFLAIVLNNPAQLSKSPMNKSISEFFDRGLKALDVCNAIRDGIEQIRQWMKSLEIVLYALDNSNSSNTDIQKRIGEGQFRRAKKALVDLTLAMLDEKESNPRAVAQRNRSFGRQRNTQKESLKSLVNFRSLSWSVSRSWSAARQLQAISYNLTTPRPNETTSTNGLNMAVFTMSYVLLFVMWALVAAIPCQDRGLQTNFYMARQFVWAGPILLLHERILEESKRRDRRNKCGLLKEILEIERCARCMDELTEFANFPLTEEKENEVRERVREVRYVYEGLKEELDPMERAVREVFSRIVRIRREGLDKMNVEQ